MKKKNYDSIKLGKINYSSLNPKQQESYNFQKLSSILAEYGYTTYRMHDDFNGADFLAIGVDGKILKVQLKGRVTVDQKYFGKNILIGFRDKDDWYLYPHDEVFDIVINHSKGASKNRARSMKNIAIWLKPKIEPYKI